MNRGTILLALLLSYGIAYTQNDRGKILEVVGLSEMFVQPDVGVLEMRISVIRMEFNETVESVTVTERTVLDFVESLGFSSGDVKTMSYRVSENEIWRSQRRYDSGYVAVQRMILEFPNDRAEIARILNGFSTSDIEAEISFRFKLSESLKKEVRDKLITMAIDDANAKATVIGESSESELGEIVEIQYGNVPERPGYLRDDFDELLSIPPTHQPRGISLGWTVQEIAYTDRVLIKYALK